MRSVQILLAVVIVLCLLTACGSSSDSLPTNVNTTQVTLVAGSVAGLSVTDTPTVTNSPTLTPTVTPTPTITPIPDVLDEMPAEITDDELAIAAGNFLFQITEVTRLKQIADSQPDSGNGYLVLHGYLYNYSDAEKKFHDVNFQIDFDEHQNVNPLLPLMEKLQQSTYPQARYPDCRTFWCRDFIVPAKKAQEIILVYEVPLEIDHLKLDFQPTDVAERSQVGIILIPLSDTNAERLDYLGLKESVGGRPTFSISFGEIDPASASVSQIVDTETYIVDNCFGTEILKRGIEISSRHASRFEVIDELSGSLKGIFTVQLLNGLFEAYARRVHEKMEEQELVITRKEEVTAAPGTKTQWRLDVYKVSFAGKMIFSVGTRNFEVPYTLSDKLRTELVSVPTEPCPASAD